MMDLVKKGLHFGIGLAFVSKEQVEKMVDDLVNKGEVNKEESRGMINQQLQQRAADMNLPTSEDIAVLQKRIDSLQQQIATLQQRVMNVDIRE